MQTLLYGGEIYPELLRCLPDWFAHRAVSDAAIVVQQMYRNRLGRKFARTQRAMMERQRQLNNIARAKRHMRAAFLLQSQWKSFKMRRKMQENINEVTITRFHARRRMAHAAHSTCARAPRLASDTSVGVHGRRGRRRSARRRRRSVRTRR